MSYHILLLIHHGCILFYYSGVNSRVLRHVRERGRMRIRRRVGPVIPPLGPALRRAFSRVPRVVQASVSLLAFCTLLEHFYPLPICLFERYVTKCKFEIKETEKQNKTHKISCVIISRYIVLLLRIISKTQFSKEKDINVRIRWLRSFEKMI